MDNSHQIPSAIRSFLTIPASPLPLHRSEDILHHLSPAHPISDYGSLGVPGFKDCHGILGILIGLLEVNPAQSCLGAQMDMFVRFAFEDLVNLLQSPLPRCQLPPCVWHSTPETHSFSLNPEPPLEKSAQRKIVTGWSNLQSLISVSIWFF